MNLGERLAKLRKAKGLSQEQLADELYLTRQTISKWELNQSTPDIDYLAKLSVYFGVTTDYLIKGEEQSDNAATISESDGDRSDVLQSNKKLYSRLFYLGGIIIGVSLMGMIAFVICAAINPWMAITGNGTYTGLLGFLIGTKTLWFFIILSLLLILGGAAVGYGLVKSFGKKK